MGQGFVSFPKPLNLELKVWVQVGAEAGILLPKGFQHKDVNLELGREDQAKTIDFGEVPVVYYKLVASLCWAIAAWSPPRIWKTWEGTWEWDRALKQNIWWWKWCFWSTLSHNLQNSISLLNRIFHVVNWDSDLFSNMVIHSATFLERPQELFFGLFGSLVCHDFWSACSAVLSVSS